MLEAYYERNLPHWYPKEAPIFLTWRLYGSLPAGFRFPGQSSAADSGREFVRVDRRLDSACSGPLWLKERAVAECVVEALRKGESDLGRYSLLAWVVMANHVHLLIQPQAPLEEITKGIKGSTARNANFILGRTGKTFWQQESFDHWVRDDAEKMKIGNYIEENPVKAGLARSPEEWQWSSAARK